MRRPPQQRADPGGRVGPVELCAAEFNCSFSFRRPTHGAISTYAVSPGADRFCADPASNGTLNLCSARSDFSTGIRKRCPWSSCLRRAPWSASGFGAYLFCEARYRMRPEPPHHENAELAEMNIEMIDTEQPANIEMLRQEIDRLDAEILAAVKRRAEVSQEIGKVRMAPGGTRLVHSREMQVIERYSELGPECKDLAMLLLRLGRGRLGH